MGGLVGLIWDESNFYVLFLTATNGVVKLGQVFYTLCVEALHLKTGIIFTHMENPLMKSTVEALVTS